MAQGIGVRKSIDNFVSNQLRRDLARKAHFRVRIQPPTGGTHWSEDTINMMCSETVFPDMSADQTGATIGTDNEYSIVNNLNYSSVDATFLCDTKHTQRQFFESWMKLTYIKNNLLVGGSPTYYNDYIGSMDITQLKHNFMEDENPNMRPQTAVKDDWTLTWRLHEVYPVSVGTMDVSWDSASEVHKLTVSFHFKSYDLISPPQT